MARLGREARQKVARTATLLPDAAEGRYVPRCAMEPNAAPLPLSTPLARPAIGGSTRLSCGGTEFVLEAVRGGHALVCSDGREARRFAVGLAPGSELAVELRVPRLPVRLVTRDTLALAPQARLRGYVQVALVPTIVCRTPTGAARVLIELPPRDLEPEWDDRQGTVLRAVSALHVRFPVRGASPKVVVPIRLVNPTTDVACPGHVPLTLLDGGLQSMRGSIVVAPLRMVWNGEQLVPVAGRHRAEIAR